MMSLYHPGTTENMEARTDVRKCPRAWEEVKSPTDSGALVRTSIRIVTTVRKLIMTSKVKDASKPTCYL